MAENKTKPTSASVDDFIAAIENPRRRADALVSLAIYKEVTGLQPVMWGPSIIGFGAIHYVYESGREGDMPAAGFSPRKANMTFYVGDGFEGVWYDRGWHDYGQKKIFGKRGRFAWRDVPVGR